MKNAILQIAVCAVASLALSACGHSQKQLKEMNNLLKASKRTDCDTIHKYLDTLQVEVEKKIRGKKK